MVARQHPKFGVSVPKGGSPRAVTRGAEHHEPPEIAGIEVGIDWLRCVGSPDLLPRALDWMVARFGVEFEERKGINFHARRWVWPNGASMWVEHASTGGFVVELPGEVVGAVGGDERVEWLRQLWDLGLWCSRIDIAIDRRDPAGRLTMVDDARAACEAGQLCRFRTWDLYQRRAGGNALRGFTVYLGRRGSDGGGRVVRVYDKGLEQAEKGRGRYGPGEWQRWETEFSADHADEVFRAIAGDFKSVTEIEMGARALGVADFREVTGRRELARRPRLAWFADLVETVGEHVQTAVGRRAARLSSCVAWMRRCVFPTLAACAAEVGEGILDVVREWSEGVGPGGSEAVRLGWCEVVGHPSWSDDKKRRLDWLLKKGSIEHANY